MKERRFDSNNVSLNYFEGPDNGPPIIVAHGGTGSWKYMHSYIEKLIPYWHVYAPDARGHGESERAINYRLKDYIDDMAGFIQNVAGSGCAFIGASLGAITGLGTSSFYPGLIHAMACMDPPLYLLRDRLFNSEIQRMFIMIKDIAQTESEEERMRKFVELRPDLTRKEASERVEQLSRFDYKVLDFMMDGSIMSGFDLDEMLRRIRQPILIVQANSIQITDDEAFRIATMIPNAELIKFPLAKHALDIRSPGIPFNVINSFLKSRYLSSSRRAYTF